MIGGESITGPAAHRAANPQKRENLRENPVGADCDVELLRSFLNAYWLRPENALWMYLRSMALRTVSLDRPCADISCGDGVFTFLHLGGRFAPAFDVFMAVDGLDRVRDEHADMFDCDAPSYRPEIVSPPVHRVDVGLDLKPNLLAKAGQLGLYDRLVEADNNRPLPVADQAFATIYCNAAYWVEDIDGFLSELRRVVRKNGSVVLQVKLDSMRSYTLEAFRGALGNRFLDIIGRGRVECWPTLANRNTWESRFSRAGLRIVEATPFVTRTHAHLWDVGLRPLAPLLIRMAESLSPSARTDIKRDWVDLWCELLRPFCDAGLDLLDGSAEPAEIQYVLTTDPGR